MYSTAPTDPPTHRPTMYRSAARPTAAGREFVQAEVVLLHLFGVSMFSRSPARSGSGDGSFRRSPPVDEGLGARSFTADKTFCHIDGTWHGCPVSGGPVAPGRAVPKGYFENRQSYEDLKLDHYYCYYYCYYYYCYYYYSCSSYCCCCYYYYYYVSLL